MLNDLVNNLRYEHQKSFLTLQIFYIVLFYLYENYCNGLILLNAVIQGVIFCLLACICYNFIFLLFFIALCIAYHFCYFVCGSLSICPNTIFWDIEFSVDTVQILYCYQSIKSTLKFYT